LKRRFDDFNTCLLVIISTFGVDETRRPKECCTAAGDDAFFNGCARGVKRVINAVFTLFDFDLGRAANLDDSDAARKFS